MASRKRRFTAAEAAEMLFRPGVNNVKILIDRKGLKVEFDIQQVPLL